jgi:hypothetical protein
MTLYLLSLACGIAYAVSIILGDSWLLLGIAGFALMIVAVISDRSLSSEKH